MRKRVRGVKVHDWGPPPMVRIGGRIYCGVWADGTLGWQLGPFLHGTDRFASKPSNEFVKGSRVYLCEITLKPVKDSAGRFITRIVR